MATKPILFSGPMVRAILEGRKTMTRRVIPELAGKDAWLVGRYKTLESPPGKVMLGEHITFRYREDSGKFRDVHVPLRFREGDVLWVRETWCNCATIDSALTNTDMYAYKADYEVSDVPWRWRPSIHMPKAAARLFLRVTDVRVERLQDMRHDEAAKEGIRAFTDPQNGIVGFCWAEGVLNIYDMPKNPTRAFEMLWNGIDAKRGHGWDANPWVWVNSFERCDRPVGWPGKVGAA